MRHRLRIFWQQVRTGLGPPAPRGSAGALRWLRHQELSSGGIRVHHRHRAAYQEVTGYLIPTLCAHGDTALARRCLDWLVRVQRADGAFCDPDQERPHLFDTAQALRGLITGFNLDPERYGPALRRAAEYLCRAAEDAEVFPRQYANGTIPESILTYGLPPLRDAGRHLSEPQWEATAARLFAGYRRTIADDLSPALLTHFLAYIIDAVLDVEGPALVFPVLRDLAATQRSDGSLPARMGSSSTCLPGLAQIAICWRRVGMCDHAQRAHAFLISAQNRSGGWYGSIGDGADYFPTSEISWAAKYVLDLEQDLL